MAVPAASPRAVAEASERLLTLDAVTETTTRRASDDRPVLRVAAALLVAVFALSVLVGFVGAPHGERFSWELTAIWGTALGTTLLAAATGWLAWSTRSEVRATQDLAELTRAQQVASERPVVIQGPSGFSGSPDAGYLQVTLRNAGLGPALRVRVSATYTGQPDWQPSIGHEIIAVIDPGGEATVQLPTSFPGPVPPGGVRGDAFPVSGDYLDRSMKNEYPIITSWPEGDEQASA
jgi:hypothetical protein